MIFFGFLILASLLLLVLIRARVWWELKVLLTVVVLGASFTQWHALDSYHGWPAHDALPASGQYVACVVEEPTPDDRAGRIYVWLVPLAEHHGLLSYTPHLGEPRSYVVPYDEGLQAACQSAAKQSAQGGSVGLRGTRSSTGGPHVKYHAYKLPPINPPIKEAP